MKQRVNFILARVTCSTNLTDAETVKVLDALRDSWQRGDNKMITIIDSNDHAMPMHIQALAVQAVSFGETTP